VVGPVNSGDEWARLVRRTQAERAAAKRRHPASGHAQPDRPGVLRAVPAQPDRQPLGPLGNPEEITMPKNIDSQDATPDWWCGGCPDPDVCTTTGSCTQQAEMDGRHQKGDALIAATRADTRDRLAAELARTNELLAYCDQTGHPAAAECRQLLLEHRHAVEALIASVDAPDEERSRLLAAADEHHRRILAALAALADR
jgi:hypothetical protein